MLQTHTQTLQIMNSQLVSPNLSVTDYPGFCLRMQQSVWGAPVMYETAWQSYQHTQFRHAANEPLPNDVAVLLWFDHWGTYGEPPIYGQFGHVATYVPGRGILSNPAKGKGQKWYNTIQECAADCNATYVGWSEDINGLRVAEITNTPPLPEGLQMANIYINTDNGQNILMKPETGFEWIIPTEAYKALVIAMGLVEQEIRATPDQINFLRQIALKP